MPCPKTKVFGRYVQGSANRSIVTAGSKFSPTVTTPKAPFPALTEILHLQEIFLNIVTELFLNKSRSIFMKKVFFLLLTAVFFTFSISAQSSEKLSEIISSKKITSGQAAYLSAVYLNAVQEQADYSQSVKALEELSLLKEGTSPNDFISIDQCAFLFAKTTGIKGGLFYTLFPTPRYAFKELQAKKIIPPDQDPSFSLSGRDAIAILNGCIDSSSK